MSQARSVLVVGAGMAGLTAAQELQAHGLAVTLLDKGRGVGGRMSSRRMNTPDGALIRVDHGAQFFTTRSPDFQQATGTWQQQGLVRVWCHGFPKSADEPHRGDGHPRYVGTPAMTSVAKHLAASLPVHRSQRVVRATIDQEGWTLRTDQDQSYRGSALLLTMPVPQALVLLDECSISLPSTERRQLDRVRYDPCLAVMAVLDGPSGLPEPGAIQFRSEPVSWIADAHQKGTAPDGHAILIHGAPGFSATHFDLDRDLAAHRLIDHCRPLLSSAVVDHQVHGWRFAAPTKLAPERTLLAALPAPLLFAGDGFCEPRVEGAFLSGKAAANRLVAHWNL